MPASKNRLTDLLQRWKSGDEEALERLTPLVYDQLHRMAHQYIRRERHGHTLQTSALINEAYLRLVDYREVDWQNRAHFFAVSAVVMRRVLVDYARQRTSGKRGGANFQISLTDTLAFSSVRAAELIALDEAMDSLNQLYPRRSKVVELRYFAGLNNEEAAAVLKVSEATIERDWRFAKAWLYRELKK